MFEALVGWSLERGARVCRDGSVRFHVWAPRAARAAVRVLRDSGFETLAMQRGDGGNFEARVPDVPAGAGYSIRLDDGPDRPDPVSRHQPEGVRGVSRVVDPLEFAWTDAGWTGVEIADLVLYEIHVGTFTPEGTLDAARQRLPELSRLGITAVELMPVAEFPGARNWGYDGAHPYAPQSTYGGPQALRRFVDAAHAAGLGVVLDVVYNHIGPEGNFLAEFGPYFSERHRTPWGAAINFDGPGCAEVRRYFIDNARYWVTEFHVDGLRLDAVETIYDASEIHILQEIGEAVHALARELGRRVLVIAESDLNDPRLLRRRAQGGYELDAQWSDDFHHALHAFLTGERSGYYADFGGLDHVVHTLRDRFVLDGRYSKHRRRRHGAPARDLPGDRFVVYIQNHDQVGNRAQAERLSTLVPPESARLAAAFLLWSPFVPLLFMGEEYGETSPFFFFVSHGEPSLAAAVREGRRREFESFGWTGEIPDPQDPETLERSRLDWSRRTRPGHAQRLQLYRDLLRLRRQEPALRAGASQVVVHSDSADWIASVLRPQTGRSLLAAFNFAAAARWVEFPELPGPRWLRVLSTDDSRYGGRGPHAPAVLRGAAAGAGRLLVPGRTAALYRPDPTPGGESPAIDLDERTQRH